LRTGIQGGTFNPIHFGHLRSAEEVREALGLDQVRFIPCAQPPHKPDDEIAPAEDRLEMVRLATEDNPAFVCDPIEVKRGGPSYTLDTLEALAGGACRGHEIFFIVGADAFAELHIWNRAPRVLRACHFAVTLRGDQRAEEILQTVKKTLKPQAETIDFEPSGENIYQVSDSKYFIHFVPISTLEISATGIRNLACSGRSMRYLLPREVELFIIRRRLFL